MVLNFILMTLSSFTEPQVFLRAVELSPDVGHSKYMYLGQIHTGQEAVDYYTRGIQVVLSALEKQETMVSEHTALCCSLIYIYCINIRWIKYSIIRPKPSYLFVHKRVLLDSL